PFAAPGAFDMGNALFGGAGAGFNNPFAPPASNTTNPFAPPPGFGAPAPAPASAAVSTPGSKSFASATSANISKEESSNENEEEEDTADGKCQESRIWPEELSSFEPHYLYITEEVLEDSDAISDDISQRYSHLLALEESLANDSPDDNNDGDSASGSANGASWSGEAYEKAALPKGVDKAFQKFTERVQYWPDQCVRYDFPGTPLMFSWSDRAAQTLLPANVARHSKHTTPSAHRIPRCPKCKGPRGFEFQLMPNLLSLLDVGATKYLAEDEKKAAKERKGAQAFEIGMEWGTVMVYSCVEDCFGKAVGKEMEAEGGVGQKVRYFEEVALVQFED
ncbi:hypothetical protein BGZ54_007612, partial [Gamsiella multidivaricata]